MATASLCSRCTPNYRWFRVAYDPVAPSIAYFSRRLLFTTAAVVCHHRVVANGEPKSQQRSRLRHLLDRETVNHSRRQLFSAVRRSQLFDCLFKVLVVIMAVSVIFTTLLGLMMAFRFAKRKVLITLILLAGILVPIFLLYLGEGARKNLKSPETTQSVPAP